MTRFDPRKNRYTLSESDRAEIRKGAAARERDAIWYRIQERKHKSAQRNAHSLERAYQIGVERRNHIADRVDGFDRDDSGESHD